MKSKDEEGNTIEVTTDWVDSGVRYVENFWFLSCSLKLSHRSRTVVSRPMPFECSVRPRDARAVELIKVLDTSEPEL